MLSVVVVVVVVVVLRVLHLFKRVCNYRRIHADVIVYIFAHLYTALRTEGSQLDLN